MLEELLYFATEPQFTELDVEELVGTTSLAYLIRSAEEEIDIDAVMLNLVYGEARKPPGSPESAADRLINRIEVTPKVELKVKIVTEVSSS